MSARRGARPPGEPARERTHLAFALAVHAASTVAQANLCLSPYSIACALGVLHRAARGSTARELGELLVSGRARGEEPSAHRSDPAGSDPAVAGQVELLGEAATLDGPPDARRDGDTPVLAVNNTLWLWEQLAFRERFRAELAALPGADLRSAPFVADPERARQEINANVAETTRELITELLPPGVVDAQTVATVVGALYLKAAWARRFTPRHTRDAPFHTPDGPRTVPMMHQVERLPYIEQGGWRGAVLGAAGGVEAVALLADGELGAAERSLDGGSLQGMLGARATRRVALHLPRLRLRTHVSLVEPLRALGVREVFGSSADLGALSDDPRLAVSDVVHESVLEMDEDGLEGAAATGALIQLTSAATDRPIELRFDRPFLLLIRHAHTGAVYFLARVSDPS